MVKPSVESLGSRVPGILFLSDVLFGKFIIINLRGYVQAEEENSMFWSFHKQDCGG
jgi:hypothetical protein